MSALLIAATLAASAGAAPVIDIGQPPVRPSAAPSCAIQDQGASRAVQCRLEAGANVQTLVLQLAQETAPCRAASQVVVLPGAPAAPTAGEKMAIEDGVTPACRR
ncbi:MAG: hypothetical protein DI570_16635 [Phenylobacterium zucineum]|nr:MAG: hypothetical protein DI570_16635 [Phenylobacterium zucineum]